MHFAPANASSRPHLADTTDNQPFILRAPALHFLQRLHPTDDFLAESNTNPLNGRARKPTLAH